MYTLDKKNVDMLVVVILSPKHGQCAQCMISRGDEEQLLPKRLQTEKLYNDEKKKKKELTVSTNKRTGEDMASIE